MAGAKIIATANQKGGVAKTSTVRNLSYSLAELGKRVLVVDFDPQSNLTMSFGVIPQKVKHTSGTLMILLLTEEALPDKAEYIQTIGKVDLIPASKALTVAEVNLLITPGSNDYLKKLLNPLRPFYDYILIDTSPALGALTINALTVADEVVIPIDPEIFALTGLHALMDSIQRVRENLNPHIKIAGVLFTKCMVRTKLYQDAKNEIKKSFAHVPMFECVIPMTVRVGEANNRGLAVEEYAENSPAAAAYRRLAREVLTYAQDQPKIENAG